MDNCVFCMIVKGEIPSYKVYEDEHTLVFMDIAKDVDGHMVAIPKKHCKNILDCDGETMAQLMTAVKKVSCNCVDCCGYDGVNLLNASDESAGQTVPHFHMHILPRKKDDGIQAWPDFAGAKTDVEQMWERLKCR